MQQQQPPQPQGPVPWNPHDAFSLPEALRPQHVEPVYLTLVQALRVDPSNPQPRRDAEAMLRAFEALPNYCDVLCSIVAR